MAPTEPTRERKRGRPSQSSAASRHGPKNESARNQANSDAVSESGPVPKKRGRPRENIEPRARDEAQPATEQIEQTASSAMTLKKRGRPPKKARGPEAAEEAAPEERPRKRRRETEEEELEGEQSNGKRGKTRRSDKASEDKASDNAPQERSDDRGAEDATRRRGRRRPADGSPVQQPPRRASHAESGQAERAKGRPGRKPENRGGQGEDREANEPSQRRSRRERVAVEDKQEGNGEEPSLGTSGPSSTQTQVPGKRRRGRPSLAEVPVSEVQNQASPPQPDKQEKKRGRGRPPRASRTDTAEPSQQAAEPSPPNRPAKPTTNHDHNHNNNNNNNLPRNRGATSSEAARATDEPPQQEDPLDMLARHGRLTALTRHIPRATIASKWTALSAPSIAAVSALLADSSRPVLHRLRDRDERRAQAALILRTFAARLHSKLVRGMPFPPPTVAGPRPRTRTRKPTTTRTTGGGHEVELDFEKTVDAVAGLERALDPLLLQHRPSSGGSASARSGRLERDYDALRRLEANARAQARGWREGRGRGREHVLVRGLVGMEAEAADGDGERERERAALELVPSSAKHGPGVVGGVFKDLQEDELLALSQRIGSHMESMKNNLSQIEGVLPAIARSRAALQGVLCEHLDPEQYEQVLLG
ncbi:hypothetical protein VTH06DRAFT_1034 [Thermothelomyces fergusii]